MQSGNSKPWRLALAGAAVAAASGVAAAAPPASHHVVVRAAGTRLQGIGPTMQLRINDVNMGSRAVQSSGFTDHVFAVPGPMPPETRIDVVFTNDAELGSEDRNLWVQHIVVDGTTYPSNGAGVVYDRGADRAAFDGLDKLPGQAAMPWDGALRFIVKPVNVQCAGDGRTDDLACLRQAISGTRNGLVVFPKGKTYRISGTLAIPSDRHLIGQGSLVFNEGDTSRAIVEIQGAQRVTIEGFRLDYRSSLAGFYGPVHIGKGAREIEVRKNILTSRSDAAGRFLAGAGVFVDGDSVADLRVLDNDISSTRFGVLVEHTLMPDAPTRVQFPTRVRIAGNRIQNVSSDAIEINSPIGGVGRVPGVATNHVEIVGNQLSAALSDATSGGFCVGVAGATQVTISGNRMAGCKWAGVHVEDFANEVLVSGNLIDGVIGRPDDQKPFFAGVRLMTQAFNIQVLDNDIRNTAGAGLEMSWNLQGQHVHHVTVQRNAFLDTGSHAVVAGALAQNPMHTDISFNSAAGRRLRMPSGSSFFVAPTARELRVYDNTELPD